MKILVTGSRKFTDRYLVEQAIIDVMSDDDNEIIVGDCPTGADLFAREFALSENVSYKVFRADWDKYGRAAGPKRNKQMVDTEPDICLAFYHVNEKNAGTRSCVKFVETSGIKLYEYIGK